jgi:hypothetical protein
LEAAAAVNERDVRVMIEWFKRWISLIEQLPCEPGRREGLNRLRGFVEILERELGERRSVN